MPRAIRVISGNNGMQQFGKVEQCCFAFDIRIQSKNNFFHSFFLTKAKEKFSDLQLIGTDTIEGEREPPST